MSERTHRSEWRAGTVIGVAPRGFSGCSRGHPPSCGCRGDGPCPAAEQLGRRCSIGRHAWAVARFKPGVSIEQARAEMRVLDRSRSRGVARRSAIPRGGQGEVEVEPAATGSRSCATARHAAAGADGRRRRCCCYRVHQRREHAAGARRGATARDGRAGVARRRTAPSGAAGADRVTPALAGRQRSSASSLRTRGAGALAFMPIVSRWPGSRSEIPVHPDLRVLLFTAGVALATGRAVRTGARLERVRSAPSRPSATSAAG